MPSGGHNAKPERNAAMQSMYDEGFSLTNIGEAFCISRERVRQLVKKNPQRIPNRVYKYRKPKRLGVDRTFLRSFAVGDGCWEWQKNKIPAGYGTFGIGPAINRKTCYAHRFSWQSFNGVIPEGMHVLHRCDNPGCVNPGHLYLGTPSDNMKDRDLRTNGNGQRSLTKTQVLEIVNKYSGTYGQKAELAKEYNVSPMVIMNLLNGKTYRYWTLPLEAQTREE